MFNKSHIKLPTTPFNRHLSNVMKISAKMFTTGTCLETLFTFQRNSAPAYRARETIGLLQCETPNFIPPGDLG